MKFTKRKAWICISPILIIFSPIVLGMLILYGFAFCVCKINGEV